MAGERGRLARHALHEIAVAADRINVEVEYREVFSIVTGAEPARGDRHADAVAATLAERPGRGLDAGGAAVFRMAGRCAVDLAEIPDVIETDGRYVGDARAVEATHAREMDQRVEQHRGVAGGQHEAIPVRP